MQNAREVSYVILNRIFFEGAYSILTFISEVNVLEKTVDRAFAKALVLGVLEKKLTIEYNLSLYLRKSLNSIKKEALTIMEMGAYQILYMDKIPVYACINETLKLLEKHKYSFLKGVANSVLRKISENGECLPGKSEKDYYSIKYSIPQDLINIFIRSYGSSKAIDIVKKLNCQSKTYIRVNSLKISAKELQDVLKTEGVDTFVIKSLDNALLIKSSVDITALNSYSKGLYHFQSLSSQMAVESMDIKKEDIVYDFCAAPGGKSFTMAQKLNNKGRILSIEIYEKRSFLIEKDAKRLGINNISVKVSDAASKKLELPLADKILCDVPCSGLGSINQKPEIRYKDLANIDKLPILQYDILNNASRFLKTFGRIVYSTCTLNFSENEGVINRFLNSHNEFVMLEVSPGTIFPTKDNTAGFYIAILEKRT